MESSRTRFVAGCMTGTSLDGLDVALAQVQGSGLEMRVQCLDQISHPLGELREELRHLTQGRPAEPIRFLRAARKLGELHAAAVAQLLARHPSVRLDFVAAHGQTIWHAPAEHLSWQLLDPWPIVRRVGAAVVYDLRQADLIAGGQGAPVTPLADWVLYRDARNAGRPQLIVNLGGICNVTCLPAGGGPEAVTGGDIGPCNLLIDGLVRRLFPGMAFDQDGRLAAQGRADESLWAWVQEHSAFFSRPQPRTTGREDFSPAWIEELVRQWGQRLSPQDLLASAVRAVAVQIAQYAAEQAATAEHPRKGFREGFWGDVVLAGGGARNPVLVEAIRSACGSAAGVYLSDELGVPVEAREALGFAVLGALSQDGVPITLPQVTGATQPGVAGVWAG